MNLNTFTFAGILTLDYSEDFKTIKLIDGDKSTDLVKKFRAIFDLFECEVSVAYFVSDKKQTEKEMLSGWLEYIHGGITAEYETNSYNYSSYTYGTDYDTYLKVGGHDLFDEFDKYYGKYCILKITVKHNQQ